MDLKNFIKDLNNIKASKLIDLYSEDLPDSLTESELVRLYSNEMGLEKLITDDWISDAKSGRYFAHLIRGLKDKTKFNVFTEERGLPLNVSTFNELEAAASEYFQHVLVVLRFCRKPKTKNQKTTNLNGNPI